MEENEFRVWLEDVIVRFLEKSREVFLLNWIEGLKYREIVFLLDISVKVVEKWMYKVLVELRKLSDLI